MYHISPILTKHAINDNTANTTPETPQRMRAL